MSSATGAGLDVLLAECDGLERFRRSSGNLYERVRALFFLYAIHCFHVPRAPGAKTARADPLHRHTRTSAQAALRGGHRYLPQRAVRRTAPAARYRAPSPPPITALAFQTLADQVRRSVRSVRGNQWMFRIGHPADHPLRIRPELLRRAAPPAAFPILREATPVRMDLTHSGWSDIFFLGMDYPEGARVLNVSIDLAVRGADRRPAPPVEAYLRVIDEPVLRLTSVDLGATADITDLAEVFDFAQRLPRPAQGGRHRLRHRAARDGRLRPEPLADLLARLIVRPGHGIEIVSKVNDIPKGRAWPSPPTCWPALISVCMRATGQTHALTGGLEEDDRRHRRRARHPRRMAGRLGRRLAGFRRRLARHEADPGRPARAKAIRNSASAAAVCCRATTYSRTRRCLARDARAARSRAWCSCTAAWRRTSARSWRWSPRNTCSAPQREWQGRQEAIRIFDEILAALAGGRHAGASALRPQRNFDGPIQTIIPWASNLYTETLIRAARAEIRRGLLGLLDARRHVRRRHGLHLRSRAARPKRSERMHDDHERDQARVWKRAVPFAMDPVVYDFAHQRARHARPSCCSGDAALMPAGYYTLIVPALLRAESRLLSPARRAELDRFGAACRDSSPSSPAWCSTSSTACCRAPRTSERRRAEPGRLLERYGFDRVQHEQIRARPARRPHRPGAEPPARQQRASKTWSRRRGRCTRRPDRGATADRARTRWPPGAWPWSRLAGGVGSRWTKGAGVVKALNPFAKPRRQAPQLHRGAPGQEPANRPRYGDAAAPRVHHQLSDPRAIEQLPRTPRAATATPARCCSRPGRSIGLRMIPMERDLRFAWEEMPQQLLDEQAQKVRESLHATLIAWAQAVGRGRATTPTTCPRSASTRSATGTKSRTCCATACWRACSQERPQLQHLMLHNIDTVGADVDPALLGLHIEPGAAHDHRSDRRGTSKTAAAAWPASTAGCAWWKVWPCRARRTSSRLSYYNTLTTWIDIDRLLAVFGLDRDASGRRRSA